MRTDNKHIDQSSELSALRNEISDLKNMMSTMQEIIINQNKQINDIYKCLFNNPIKSKDQVKEQKKQDMKNQIILKNLRK
ncbi:MULTISPECIES: hypothetical protein [Sphingobacterium]|uniref:Uncharacterized protein n=1 Tax=Sphingobacterium athyrii TaxID=2152717 RepID=A0A363NUP1_9SPHI|nr:MULTISPECIES: hypothetical protein [Sphingobacterium]PUV24532.1 hypothetical protein DCO56_14415 [Sphingobacterium athyrii]QIH33882.1 hypothetical protein G6053_13755 [Sphingobacterium sp. DR205]